MGLLEKPNIVKIARGIQYFFHLMLIKNMRENDQESAIHHRLPLSKMSSPLIPLYEFISFHWMH